MKLDPRQQFDNADEQLSPSGEARLAALDALLADRASAGSSLPGLALAVEAQVSYRLEAERWLQHNRGSMYLRVRRSAVSRPRGPLLMALSRALMTRSAAQVGAVLLGALVGYFTLMEVVIPAMSSLPVVSPGTSSTWGGVQVTPIGLAAAGAAVCALAALASTQLRTLRREYF